VCNRVNQLQEVKKEKVTISGTERFGLLEHNVVRLLEDLVQSEKCTKYKFKKNLPKDQAEWLNNISNQSLSFNSLISILTFKFIFLSLFFFGTIYDFLKILSFLFFEYLSDHLYFFEIVAKLATFLSFSHHTLFPKSFFFCFRYSSKHLLFEISFLLEFSLYFLRYIVADTFFSCFIIVSQIIHVFSY